MIYFNAKGTEKLNSIPEIFLKLGGTTNKEVNQNNEQSQGPYIYDVHMEGGWGDLEISCVCRFYWF